MTYCCALKLNGGILLASDCRTNAGVDDVSSFPKYKAFERAGDRWIGCVWSGHLGITQAVIHDLAHACEQAEPGTPSLMNAASMWDVASLFGQALRGARMRDSYLYDAGVDTGANFLVAGQIGSEPCRLFLIYSEGNFIEVSEDAPYFQIGETKYGKPILDQVIHPNLSLDDAIKCALVSFDSTMRSNLSVGLPIDMMVYPAGSLKAAALWRFGAEQDPYYQLLRDRWGHGLREVFAGLPKLQWPVGF